MYRFIGYLCLQNIAQMDLTLGFIPVIMTGQILSGVSPLIATRYQIMVMLMHPWINRHLNGDFFTLVEAGDNTDFRNTRFYGSIIGAFERECVKKGLS